MSAARPTAGVGSGIQDSVSVDTAFAARYKRGVPITARSWNPARPRTLDAMPGSKPGEIVLYTEVTTTCSHRCDFCPIHLVERHGNIQPDVQRAVVNLISSYPDHKFVVYPHLVGEPLLFPGLVEYLRNLAALPNVELWLCTNGVFLDESRLQEFEAAGLKNIWFCHVLRHAGRLSPTHWFHRFETARRNSVAPEASFKIRQNPRRSLFPGDRRNRSANREKSNVTLDPATFHPWQPRPMSRQQGRSISFFDHGKFRERDITASIDGEVGSDWRDYNLRNLWETSETWIGRGSCARLMPGSLMF